MSTTELPVIGDYLSMCKSGPNIARFQYKHVFRPLKNIPTYVLKTAEHFRFKMDDSSQVDDDFAFAQMLESQYALEDAHKEVIGLIPPEFVIGSPPPKRTFKPNSTFQKSNDKTNQKGISIIAPEWEDLDPTPDLHALFMQFNDRFFWGKLAACKYKLGQLQCI